jgi:hypothetical protein
MYKMILFYILHMLKFFVLMYYKASCASAMAMHLFKYKIDFFTAKIEECYVNSFPSVSLHVRL